MSKGGYEPQEIRRVRTPRKGEIPAVVEQILNDGEHLYKSLSDLILYATGAAECSTSDLLLVLDDINNSMDNIEMHLNRSYFETWRYIQLRIGYWKAKVYRSKNIQEIANDAFGRWRNASKLNSE